MPNIFLSYNRQSGAIAKTLVADIEALGHTVWFDQDLSGGQVWWNQILTTIRNCDVFVFVLDPESLDSTACKREYGYAADLGKPVLPVLAAEGVSANLLPPALSQIQFVDYRKQDRDSALRLARALAAVPRPKPLPDPLPPPPEVPISYLGSLTQQVETTAALSYEQQSALVVDLRKSLRDPETVADGRKLLERLRKRRDLFATIAEEIEELLTEGRKPSPAKPEPPPLKAEATPKTPPALPATHPAPAASERLTCAVVGAILGTVIGVAAMTTYRESWRYGLLTGAGGAIAGAISGARRNAIHAVLFGATLGWIALSLLFSALGGQGSFAAGGVFGAPSGAILGAIVGVIVQRKKA